MTDEGKTAPSTSSQLGLVDGKRFEDWPRWEGKGVPLRENCDLTNPRQAFLWQYTALPGLKGAPLLMPVDYWELISFRQWVLGARPAAEPQLKYQPPLNVANAWTAQGKWVGLDEPDPPRPSLRDVVDKLGQADRAELKDIVLEQMGLGGEPIPDVPAGKYRVMDLAARLSITSDEMIETLGRFGMTVNPNSLVGRDVADRIIAHMGLD